MESLIFLVVSAAVAVSATVVITRTNPIASALALVGVFVGLSGLYAMLGAGFAAVMQIFVYAGGIMVLILFVIMILNLSSGDLLPMKANSATVGLSLLAVVIGAVAPLVTVFNAGFQAPGASQVEPGFGGIVAASRLMFGKYVFPFEVLSLVLLTAMVGALVISKRRL